MKDQLIGEWELIEGWFPSQTSVTFTDDGKLELQTRLGVGVVTTDGTYEVVGNRLVVNRRGAAREVFTIEELTDLDLRATDEKGDVVSFIRLSEPLERPADCVPVQPQTADVRDRNAVRAEFGYSDDEFDLLFRSYQFSLSTSGKQSNWNDDIEGYARGLGALREAEIALAKMDLFQAILNRIIVRAATEGRGS